MSCSRSASRGSAARCRMLADASLRSPSARPHSRGSTACITPSSSCRSLGALIAGLFGRVLGDARRARSSPPACLLLAAVLSWIVFVPVGFRPRDRQGAADALDHLGRSRGVAGRSAIDTLTAVMLVVVNTVSALVHLYSIGYMHEDRSRPRFFAYLSLFTFAMLMLVTSDNLLQMFFGWEGVGLASYLLIGFWYKKPAANAAAIKAFVVNRVGDFGFALGIFGLFCVFELDPASTRCSPRRPRLAGKTVHVPRLPGRHPDDAVPAAVHGRHGQVGAVPAAHLAAGRHGGPDAGLGADPRRDHGDRRRVHGGAPVAAVRTGARRAARSSR